MQDKDGTTGRKEDNSQDNGERKSGGQVAKNSGEKKGYNISNPVKGLKLNIRPIYG